MYTGCVHHHPHACGGWPAPTYMVCYVPVLWSPPGPSFGHALPVTREVNASPTTSPQEALIGGMSEAFLSLEYQATTGATSPAVKLTITAEGTTSTWSEAGIATGYHVKHHLVSVRPGSKVVLEVTEATARLTWCETIHC
jgi:hypothetical protein